MKILLVEDDEMNRDMLSRRLIKKGFEVLMSDHGEQVIEIVHTNLPELVLMDLNLPGIDGWEVTRRIKADDVISHIPVIALTAHAFESDREKALAAGCKEYLTKPVELDQLLDKIKCVTNWSPLDE